MIMSSGRQHGTLILISSPNMSRHGQFIRTMLPSTLSCLPNSSIGGRPAREVVRLSGHPIRCTTYCTTFFCLFVGETIRNGGTESKPNAPAMRLPAKGK